MVPTFTLKPFDRSAPNYAPAASPRLRRRLHRGLSAGDINQLRSSPRRDDDDGVCAAAQPTSAKFELVDLLRGVQSLVPRVRLLPRLPGPPHVAILVRPVVVRAAVHPFSRTRDQAALSFGRLAATSRRRCPFITTRFKSASWRSMSQHHNSFGRVASSWGAA